MKRKQKNTRAFRLKKIFHRHIKLAFVPHGANQYRPHLVRRYGLMALLVGIIGVQAVYNFSATGTVLGVKSQVTSQELVADTNARRAQHGLSELRVDDQLSKAAFLKANDMFRQQYWAHVAPDGTTPWHWLGVAGYNYAAAGENLAKNFSTSDAALTAWMASSVHRKNVLAEEYTDVGFAVVDGTLNGEPATLIVALYGEPASTPVVAGMTAPVTAAAPQAMSPMTRLGVAFISMTPAVFASLVMATVAMAAALTAHVYRRKLPRHKRESWYRHHGILKAAGMLSLIVMIVFLYSGGQI